MDVANGASDNLESFRRVFRRFTHLLGDFVGIIRFHAEIRKLLLELLNDSKTIDHSIDLRLEGRPSVAKTVFLIQGRCGRVHGATCCRNCTTLIIVSQSTYRLCKFRFRRLRQMPGFSLIK